MMKVNFNNNLKILRLAKKISQKELAEKMNTTIKTISHWETGYTEPSLQQLVMLSNIFDISIDDLILN